MVDVPSIQVISLSGDLSLVPVIEFEPGRYSRGERAYPQQSGREAPEAWSHYWQECLADAGIHGLVPLRLASWFVPVQHIPDRHTLRQLVRTEFETVSFSGNAEEVDHVGRLCGGYALLEAGQLVIEPRCCGDLSNLDSWRNASLRRAEEFFWIGHPMLHASMKGEQLALREDEAEHAIDEPLREWLLPPGALVQAIPAAAREQEAFAFRLESILAEFVDSALVLPLAQRLAGLDR